MTSTARVVVTPRGRGRFHVEVRSDGVTTTYAVEVPTGMAAELGWGADEEADLVSASFRFLLEREPAASILPRFSLEVIEHYFPEYRSQIRRHNTGRNGT